MVVAREALNYARTFRSHPTNLSKGPVLGYKKTVVKPFKMASTRIIPNDKTDQANLMVKGKLDQVSCIDQRSRIKLITSSTNNWIKLLNIVHRQVDRASCIFWEKLDGAIRIVHRQVEWASFPQTTESG
jgi:hypothetical protein